MGIYGNIILNFQSQFIDLTSFDMLPLVNSGFDTTKDRNSNVSTITTFRGCFQNLTANQLKNNNGNLVTTDNGNLWSNTKLVLGNFVNNPVDGYTYRIKSENTWDRESGFFYYDVVQVVGDDGTFTVEPEFNEGVDNLT
jgi:hypothetical protein